MSIISSADYIWVTAFGMGGKLLSAKLTGICSRSELFRKVRELLKEHIGEFLTLEFRNVSRGWSHRAPYMLAA